MPKTFNAFVQATENARYNGGGLKALDCERRAQFTEAGVSRFETHKLLGHVGRTSTINVE